MLKIDYKLFIDKGLIVNLNDRINSEFYHFAQN